MIEQFDAGDPAARSRPSPDWCHSIDAMMGVPNYGATTAKAALELLGVLDNRASAAPLVPLDDDELATPCAPP